MIVNLTFENASVQSAVAINRFTAVALWQRLGELLGSADVAEDEEATCGSGGPGAALATAAGGARARLALVTTERAGRTVADC